MKKHYLFTAAFSFLSFIALGQWQPTGATSGDIYYNGGNVGIGKENPSTKLQVNGTAQVIGGHDLWSGIVLTADATDEPKLGFRVSDNSERFKIKFLGVNGINERLGFIKGLNGEAEVFSILKNGNIGIGAIAPKTLLQVGESNGSSNKIIRIPGNYNFEALNLKMGANGNAELEFITHSNLTSSAGVRFYSTDGANLEIQTAPVVDSSLPENSLDPQNKLTYNTKMLIQNNGKVGIGTKNLQGNEYLLFVKDGIRTEKVKVDIASANNWSDYVFEPAYQLPSLSQVETYIKENKHLPDVPSAKEVEKEGLDLGKMDATLLKKIEELTLYMIEMKKEISELKGKNSQLEQLLKK